MTQSLIVGLMVGCASLYSLWVLLPAALRRAAAARLARHAGRWGLGEAHAARLRATLETAGACSECAKCKGCATPGRTLRADAVPVAPRGAVSSIAAAPDPSRSPAGGHAMHRTVITERGRTGGARA